MAQGRDIRAGKAFVELTTRDNALSKGLSRAQKKLAAWGSAVSGMGKEMMKMGAAMTAPFLVAIRLFATMGSEIADAAGRMGVSAEQVSRLKFAAEQSGASLAEVEVAVKKMANAITDAANGSKSAEKALANLGMTAEELVGLTPDEQFLRIAEAISKISDPTRRAAASMDVFGKSGTSMLPMIQNGAAGIAALTKQCDALGLTMSGEDARAADDFGDAMASLWQQVKMVGFHVGATVAKALMPFVARVGEAMRTAIDWVKANRVLVLALAGVAAGLIAGGAALVTFGTALTVVGTALGAVAAAVSFVVSPVGLLTAALVTAGVAFFKFSTTGGEALSWLSDRFRELHEFTKEVFAGIGNALANGNIRAAADVLWAALKVAWYGGITALRTKWSEFLHGITNAAFTSFWGLSRIASAVFKAIAQAVVTAVGAMRQAWALFTAGAKIGMVEVERLSIKAFAKVAGLANKNFPAAAIEQMADANAAKSRGQIASDTASELAGISGQQAAASAAIDATVDAAIAAAQKKVKDALTRLGSSGDDGLAQALEELKKAQEQLANNVAAAKSLTGGVSGGGPKASTLAGELSEAVSESMVQARSRGTFNSQALQQFQGARADTVPAKIDKTNQLLAALVRRTVASAFS